SRLPSEPGEPSGPVPSLSRGRPLTPGPFSPAHPRREVGQQMRGLKEQKPQRRLRLPPAPRRQRYPLSPVPSRTPRQRKARLPPADIDLTSAQVRRELPARAKPYWHISTPGVHLGYYKGGRGAAWYGRKFVGEGRYRQTKLGPSRDEDAAGGLSFVEALEALVAWASDEAPINGAAAPAPREGRRQAERAAKQLQPTRLDTISRAWAQVRPDVDFWLAGFFLRIEYAHYLHDRRVQEVAKQAGANVGDLHVLLALRRNGPGVAMRPTDLYRELLVTSGAITKR